MVKVEKCCFCVRLSNFAIIIGCFGAFLSLILIILVGSFLLTYDNLVTILHKKGDFDSVQVSTFLEKYKNSKRNNSKNSCKNWFIFLFLNSRDNNRLHLHRLASIFLRLKCFLSLWGSKCKSHSQKFTMKLKTYNFSETSNIPHFMACFSIILGCFLGFGRLTRKRRKSSNLCSFIGLFLDLHLLTSSVNARFIR